MRKTPKKSREHVRFKKNPVCEFIVVNGQVCPYIPLRRLPPIPPVHKTIRPGKVGKRSPTS
jgi:hypothetical protein